MATTTQHIVSITKEQYKPYQKLENLTAKQCYDKYGLKECEGVSNNFYFGDRFMITLDQNIPYQEEFTTQAYASLYDGLTDTWYDCPECDDTILGEWYFILNDDEEIYVDIKIKE